MYTVFSIGNSIQPVNCTTGDIRLVGGEQESEGRLEVCINQVWGTVCGRYWSSQDSSIACRQLGHQALGTCIVINCCNNLSFLKQEQPLFIVVLLVEAVVP